MSFFDASVGSIIAFVLLAASLAYFALRYRSAELPTGRLVGLSIRLACFALFAFYLLPKAVEVDAADAAAYHISGLMNAEFISSGQWNQIPIEHGFAMINIATGVLYSLLGPCLYGMCLLAAMFSLWSAVFVNEALILIEGEPIARRFFVSLPFVLPSYAVWTSLFGKDSPIGLGLAATLLGFVRYTKTTKSLSSLALVYSGVLLIGVIRIHIAGALLTAVTVGLVVHIVRCRPRNKTISLVAIVATGVGLAVAVAIASTLPVVNGEAVNSESASGFFNVAGVVTQGNMMGDSVVDIRPIDSVSSLFLAIPEGLVRVFLRPFPWEAYNPTSALAAIENVGIAIFLIVNRRRLFANIKRIWSNPIIAFATVYCILVFVWLLPIPNLGLLSRQRAMLLPYALLLFSSSSVTAPARSKRSPIRRTTFAFQSQL
jgi:hypothetical protein